MHQQVENVERPFALFIIAVLLGAAVFFGVRHFGKLREEKKREQTYQSTLQCYRRILEPGMKRKEVEDHLRAKNMEFVQLQGDDLSKIGEDDSPVWFCGNTDVFLQFQFSTPSQQDPRSATNSDDKLSEIEIIRRGSGCL